MNSISIDGDNNIVVQNEETNLEYKCLKPEIFNRSEYEYARASWNARMNEYNRLNWFKKLFTEKPSEPNPMSFIHY